MWGARLGAVERYPQRKEPAHLFVDSGMVCFLQMLQLQSIWTNQLLTDRTCTNVLKKFSQRSAQQAGHAMTASLLAKCGMNVD